MRVFRSGSIVLLALLPILSSCAISGVGVGARPNAISAATPGPGPAVSAPFEPFVPAGSPPVAPGLPEPDRRRFAHRFLFPASDGIHGNELYAYDGVTAPVLAADVNGGGSTGDSGSFPSGMTTLGGRTYFSADDGRSGRELHFYDEISQRHGLAAEINRMPGKGSEPEGLFSHGGRLYFSADDGIIGRELWSYNPVDRTVRSYDLNPGGDSNPGRFSPCGGRLFFMANSSAGSETRRLWVLDESAGSPTAAPGAGGLYIGDVSSVSFGGRILMGADDGAGRGMEPWSYDCVNRQASAIGDLNPFGGSSPSGFAFVGEKTFFSADDGVHGIEVWSTEGVTGAWNMAELNGWGDTYPAELTPFAGKLFFSGFDVNFRLLCSLDPASTAPVSCFRDFHEPVGLRVHEGMLFFSAFVPCAGECSESLGRELWRYDGTGRPYMVEDIWPGPGNGM